MKKFSLLRITALLIALFVLAVQLASCGSLMTVSAADLMEEIEANTVSGKNTDDEFKAAMANFAVKLFKNSLDKDRDNSLISPLSVVLAMAMVTNGADGQTKAELEEAFGMPIDKLNEYLYTYVNNLSSTEKAKVVLANSVWFDSERVNVLESFLQTNADYYNAQAYSKDFDNGDTVNEINKWVNDHTDEMIDKIIDKIDSDAIMYLINAIVFDAKWQEEYPDESVYNDIFTSYDGTQSTVDFMASDETLYIQDGNALGFIKNYSGNKYSFAAIMPGKDTDIFDYINTLNGEKLLDILASKKSGIVSASLPKFDYDYKIELNDSLKAMGINAAFCEADFSKLGSSPLGNIYIGKVLHKTHIEVTQSGTRAAAVTAVQMNAESAIIGENVTVKLDRPFVYCIIDNTTNLPIFIGVVTNLG